jgi:hypothetical protein
MPATYDRVHKIVAICAIVLLLVGNDVDRGRQSATSHTPKIIAGIERTACEMNCAKFKGELKYICMELLLRGDITKTVEKLTSVTPTTTIIIIPCTK